MDRRNPRTARLPVRCFSDIRQLPLLVGLIQCLWSFIPIWDIDGSLFSKQLEALNIGREWGWLMFCTGIHLMIGAAYARRETLVIALFLSACVWGALTVTFMDASWRLPGPQWITPVSLAMPVITVALVMALVREMLYQPVIIVERRRARG